MDIEVLKVVPEDKVLKDHKVLEVLNHGALKDHKAHKVIKVVLMVLKADKVVGELKDLKVTKVLPQQVPEVLPDTEVLKVIKVV